MIKVEIENGEYLVYIPYAQRDRIKAISGYRWNPAKRAWCFPQRQSYKDAILAEFGADEISADDLVALELHPPAPLHELVVQDLEVSDYLFGLLNQITTLERKIASEHDRQIELISGQLEAQRKLLDFLEIFDEAGFEEALSHDEMLSVLRASLTEKLDIAGLLARLATAESQVDSLRIENRSLKANAEPTSSEAEHEAIVQIAHELLGPQLSSNTRLDRFRLDESGPILLQTMLHDLLALKVGNSDERTKFVDLINEASDAQIITRDGKQFCHFVRVQRNLFAHEHVPHVEVRARTALALMAYTLAAKEILR